MASTEILLITPEKSVRKSPSPNFKEAQEKYKTEQCKNWVNGFCKYGKNCLFAHGVEEVRQKNLPGNYKTKYCVNILREGYCKYGEKCQFKHQDREREPLFSLYTENGPFFREIRKLPVFLDIERRCN